MIEQGKRLKQIRQALGLSQDDLGSVLGISKQFYSNIETDRTKLNNEKLVLLCTEYDVNINYLLCGKGEMFIKEQPADFKSTVKQAIQELIREGELNKDDFV